MAATAAPGGIQSRASRCIDMLDSTMAKTMNALGTAHHGSKEPSAAPKIQDPGG